MIIKTLGHYSVSTLIGRGGMGEVYKAKDQKLGRDVAIKVLPEEFAKDTDRVARFQREAKLLASLNHPNIAAIYGLEESDGTHFLVLELIEGDTLADRLKREAIPVEESLKLALQIAEALEAAHEKGVIHRDLKPANIKVTPEGKVKVLDFGLAKAFAGEQTDLTLSNSPTLSQAATMQGVILGTAAYMSPEQARGIPVDKRTDIWAFGCVLYEMLTGKAAFSGQDVSDILAAVIRAEPEWGSLPANLHGRLHELIERCLKKELKDRYHDISDVRVDIQKVLSDPGGVFVQQVASVEPRARLRIIFPWVAAALILGAIIAGEAVWNLKPTPAPQTRQVVSFEYQLPEDQQFSKNPLIDNIELAVSPDGSSFVYSTPKGLYLRSVDELAPKFIAGTDENSVQPFFSSDGQWVGYWSQTENQLKKVPTGGGAPIVLCEAMRIYGARWCSDNKIVYSQYPGGIMKISGNGGTPESLVKVDLTEGGIGIPEAPQILPDGKTLLFTSLSNVTGGGKSQIVIQSLESGERKVLFAGGYASYLPTGHLIYWQRNNLFAVTFNLDKLEVAGGPISVLEGVWTGAISDSGTLVYVRPQPSAVESGSKTGPGRTLVWIDRKGREEPLNAPPDIYRFPKISPDGTRVALTVASNRIDIWIWDLVRKTLTPLTFEGTVNTTPVWTPDGKQIIFWSSGREGAAAFGSIYMKASDGTGKAKHLFTVPDRYFLPFSLSSDGKALIGTEAMNAQTPQTFDLGMLSMEGDRAHKPLIHEKYYEAQPQISPDGRFIAYTSDGSGQNEIYVCPFPEVNKGRWRVSTNGGESPL